VDKQPVRQLRNALAAELLDQRSQAFIIAKLPDLRTPENGIAIERYRDPSSSYPRVCA